jgi:hypothetical protein
MFEVAAGSRFRDARPLREVVVAHLPPAVDAVRHGEPGLTPQSG